ncbi:hypothetical protein V6N13_008029 [Hibiscus sabdariffa]
MIVDTNQHHEVYQSVPNAETEPGSLMLSWNEDLPSWNIVVSESAEPRSWSENELTYGAITADAEKRKGRPCKNPPKDQGLANVGASTIWCKEDIVRDIAKIIEEREKARSINMLCDDMGYD